MKTMIFLKTATGRVSGSAEQTMKEEFIQKRGADFFISFTPPHRKFFPLPTQCNSANTCANLKLTGWAAPFKIPVCGFSASSWAGLAWQPFPCSEWIISDWLRRNSNWKYHLLIVRYIPLKIPCVHKLANTNIACRSIPKQEQIK